MKKIIKRNWLLVMFLLLALIGLSFLVSPSYAEENSESQLPEGGALIEQNFKIHVTSFDVKEFNLEDQGALWGKIEISNFSKEEKYSNIGYRINLLKVSDMKLIDVAPSEEFFSLNSGEKKEFDFKYKLPDLLSAGDYILRAVAVSNRGEIVGFSDHKFTLNEDYSDTILLDSTEDFYYLRINDDSENEVESLTGPTIKSSDTVKVRFNLKNNNSKTLENIIAKGETSDRYIENEVVSSFQEKIESFQPNEEKIILINLPINELSHPSSYITNILLTQDGKQIAPLIQARVVLEGVQGKILQLKMDKENYNQGDVAKVNTEIIGSPFNDSIGSSLDIFLASGDYICGKKSFSVGELGTSALKRDLEINVDKNCPNTNLIIQLKADGKVLDENRVASSQFPTEKKVEEINNFDNTQEGIEKNEKESQKGLLVIGTIILIVLLFLAGIIISIFFKKKAGNNLLIVILFAGFGLFMGNYCKSQTYALDNFIWHNPYDDQVYERRDTITVRVYGNVIRWCGNAAHSSSHTDLIIKTRVDGSTIGSDQKVYGSHSYSIGEGSEFGVGVHSIQLLFYYDYYGDTGYLGHSEIRHFEVVPNNISPQSPTCENCPLSLGEEEMGTFRFRSSDINEEDDIKFIIDWGSDNFMDIETGFMSQPVYYDAVNSWSESGLKPYKVIAYDGDRWSDWSHFTVQVVPPCDISVSPSSLTFTSHEGDTPEEQQIEIVNNNSETLTIGLLESTGNVVMSPSLVTISPNETGIVSVGVSSNETSGLYSYSINLENGQLAGGSTCDPNSNISVSHNVLAVSCGSITSSCEKPSGNLCVPESSFIDPPGVFFNSSANEWQWSCGSDNCSASKVCNSVSGYREVLP